ncbi:MAG: AAA family ATPase [Oligoflexia bacterium]|nr:AAA family ATPase [Oligoflexia bacterium]
MKFIGREKELSCLLSLTDGSKNKTDHIAVIYGRRRIGKSELIRQAFKNKFLLYFEGVENQSKGRQIEHFLLQLQEQINEQTHTKTQNYNNNDSKTAKSWAKALLLLKPVVKGKKVVIVFDEFQWMANYRSELVSELKMVWELYLSKMAKSITLILCGSIASFMIKKVVNSSALYGRIDLELPIKELAAIEANQLLGNKGRSELFEAYMLLGGVPFYLNLIKDKSSIRIGIDDLCFRREGALFNEYKKIFLGHFGKNPHYQKILSTLIQRPYSLLRTDIIDALQVEAGGEISKYLFDLESAGLIMGLTPVDKGENSKLTRYMIADPFISFHQSFIDPNKKKIELGIETVFKTITSGPKYYSFLGRMFELFCIKNAKKLSSILGFSDVEFNYGPFYHHKKIQIDLMYLRKDNVITMVEIKYCGYKQISLAVIKEVEKKVDYLRKIFPSKTIQTILVVNSNDVLPKSILSNNIFYKVIHFDNFFI